MLNVVFNQICNNPFSNTKHCFILLLYVNSILVEMLWENATRFQSSGSNSYHGNNLLYCEGLVGISDLMAYIVSILVVEFSKVFNTGGWDYVE